MLPQVARWRISAGAFDPHPFTISGRVPEAQPRGAAHGRHIEPDLAFALVDGHGNRSRAKHAHSLIAC